MTAKVQLWVPSRQVTASTITDDEVRALRGTLAGRSDRRGLHLVRMCDAVLGALMCSDTERAYARGECADAFNSCPIRPEVIS